MARLSVDGVTERARRADVPVSPPAVRLGRARWRDLRLLGGVLLVLASVVLGARVLTAANDTTPVWAASHDLSPGIALRSGDLVRRDVRLQSVAGKYLSAKGAPPTGYVLTRPVTSGELVPASAVTAAGVAPDRRLVTVPVDRFHRPDDLRRGVRVDVYVTPTQTGSSSAGSTSLVLSAVTVNDVLTDGGRLGPTGDSEGVVLAVPPQDVPAVVAASRSGTLDLVEVPEPGS